MFQFPGGLIEIPGKLGRHIDWFFSPEDLRQGGPGIIPVIFQGRSILRSIFSLIAMAAPEGHHY